MPGGKAAVLVVVLWGANFVGVERSQAFDLAGAWASSAEQCNKVFMRNERSNNVTFTRFSGVHGGGFIADGKRLRGKFEICSIRSRKEEGDTLNLIVGCASGIMTSNVQIVLKILDENSIHRLFPGMEGMEMPYYRCQI